MGAQECGTGIEPKKKPRTMAGLCLFDTFD